MKSINIASRAAGCGVELLRLSGSLRVGEATAKVRDKTMDSLGTGTVLIVFDMKRVSSLDAGAVEQLVRLRRMAHLIGSEIRILHAPRTITLSLLVRLVVTFDMIYERDHDAFHGDKGLRTSDRSSPNLDARLEILEGKVQVLEKVVNGDLE
ncbi:MAG: hypothetical protein LAP85_04785 [Acidobacteriia bacterium]|nr:hypothetical protein [Terriglobia bacterium]